MSGLRGFTYAYEARAHKVMKIVKFGNLTYADMIALCLSGTEAKKIAAAMNATESHPIVTTSVGADAAGEKEILQP